MQVCVSYCILLCVCVGTNLQALMEQAKKPSSSAEIVVVISNRPGVLGLKRASMAGIQTRVTLRRLSFNNAQDQLEIFLLLMFLILSPKFQYTYSSQISGITRMRFPVESGSSQGLFLIISGRFSSAPSPPAYSLGINSNFKLSFLFWLFTFL